MNFLGAANMSSTKAITPTLSLLGNGIYSIDALYVRPGLASIYLIISEGRAAFVETGTRHSMSQVLDALESLGIRKSKVDFVIPTHVHLDHAGGAGTMMDLFPNAKLVVHPRGAGHMEEPSRLWAGTVAVYGELAARELYGEITPVARDRMVAATEGLGLALGGRRLKIIDTPGHCRHHICIEDSETLGIFTGDLFGIRYRDVGAKGQSPVIVSTTPTQFDPVEMRRSIKRVASMKPPAVFMTHYSRANAVDDLAGELLCQLDEHVRIALAHAESPESDRVERIANDLRCFFKDEGKRLGWDLSVQTFDELIMPDLRLNSLGLAHWISTLQDQA